MEIKLQITNNKYQINHNDQNSKLDWTETSTRATFSLSSSRRMVKSPTAGQLFWTLSIGI
jgi:hypothetical protein